MNIMKKELDSQSYTVTLESGETYTGVPCLGAYEDEREAHGEIFGGRTSGGQTIKGLFEEKASSHGVLFYYEGDADRSRYIFVKSGGIFEPVYMK
jgi:hypothetical protein